MADCRYWIWFQILFGQGTRRSHEVLEHHPDPAALYAAVESRGTAAAALSQKELAAGERAMEEADRLERRCRKLGVEIVTPDHPSYPPLLRHIYAQPAALYVRGSLDCLRDAPALAIVGSRTPTPYGKQSAHHLARDLAARGAVVVSGLARGVDTAAHQGALEAGGCTVGLLACGLDVDYPKGSAPLKAEMCRRGAVATESPLGTPARPEGFPLRNRIIAGICQATIVAECGAKSGTMITARHAREQDREVFAVPGNIFSPLQEGPHGLLRDGARPATGAPQILEELGYTLRPVEGQGAAALPGNLSRSAQALYRALGAELEPLDALASRTNLPVGELQAALLELELAGLLLAEGGRYARG